MPDVFSFSGITGADRSQLYESESITISGITKAAPISISQGKYRIDEGDWTTQSGTVLPGNSVQIQLESSSQYASSVSSTLFIGGVSASFTVTTLTPVSTG